MFFQGRQRAADLDQIGRPIDRIVELGELGANFVKWYGDGHVSGGWCDPSFEPTWQQNRFSIPHYMRSAYASSWHPKAVKPPDCRVGPARGPPRSGDPRAQAHRNAYRNAYR